MGKWHLGDAPAWGEAPSEPRGAARTEPRPPGEPDGISGLVDEAPAIQLELYPTALAAAGVRVEPGWDLDGVAPLPFAKGAAAGVPHDALYWRQGPQMAIRRGEWKLVRYDRAVDRAGVPSDARATEVTPGRLYDIALDPGEARDLADGQPGRVAALRRAWQAWDAGLMPPRWGPG